MNNQKVITNRKNLYAFKGKLLAFLLRHDKMYDFDQHGWRKVSDLTENHGFTVSELEEIVENDNKNRYEFSDDKSSIRARQGHSISVDVELEEKTPPDVLYHGTASRFISSIMDQGIMKMTRLYVHLSPTFETAVNVGKRHGSPAVLTIDSKKMASDGCKFYLSRNGVWLTDFVDIKYINGIWKNCLDNQTDSTLKQ